MAARTSLTHQERAERRRKMAGEVKRTGSLDQVAKKYGVTISSVRFACVENQVAVPKAPRKQASNTAMQIVGDLLAGKTQAELVKKYKVTRQRISQIKQQAVEAGLLKRTSTPT